MLYSVTKSFLSFCVGEYFSKITVVGAPLCESGPVLLAVNHPNFALDSLLVGGAFQRELWYIGKSTLFKGAIRRRILRSLHMIPIYRRQDNPGDMSKNADAFEEVITHLLQHHAVAIFPEGQSLGERRLSPIKTGIARIALLALERSNYELSLKIQPIGITYGVITEFKSPVTISAGVPIDVRRYAAEQKRDGKEAVRKLTEDIEAGLRDVTVQVSNAAHEAFAEKLGKLYASRGSALDDRERLLLISKNLEALEPKLPGKREEVEAKLDAIVSKLPGPGKKESPFVLLCMTPFLLWGLVSSFVPYRMTGTIVKKISDHHVYLSSRKLFLGILLYSAWYLFLAIVFYFTIRDVVLSFVFLLTTIISSIFLSRYWNSYAALLGKHSHRVRARDELIAELDSLRIA